MIQEEEIEQREADFEVSFHCVVFRAQTREALQKEKSDEGGRNVFSDVRKENLRPKPKETILRRFGKRNSNRTKRSDSPTIRKERSSTETKRSGLPRARITPRQGNSFSQKTKSISGDNGMRAPPVPIPNTEVKPHSADGTWLETARESRSSPDSKDVNEETS